MACRGYTEPRTGLDAIPKYRCNTWQRQQITASTRKPRPAGGGWRLPPKAAQRSPCSVALRASIRQTPTSEHRRRRRCHRAKTHPLPTLRRNIHTPPQHGEGERRNQRHTAVRHVQDLIRPNVLKSRTSKSDVRSTTPNGTRE